MAALVEKLGVGADDAAGGAVTRALAEECSGALGPILTPARRGHTMPMTKPSAAITPTFTHDGRSSPGEGT